MTQVNLPVKESKALIEIPEFIPQVGFLGGKEGKEINEEIQAKYKKFSALQKSFYSKGIVKGSNPFYVVAVNEIIRSKGLRTATQADLERVLKTETLDLRGYYEDSALILRNEDKPNAYLERDLTRQIKEKIGKDRKIPIMIPFSGLELRADQDSEHGLAFNLTDDSEIIYAPQLSRKNNYKKFSETNDKGLPIFSKDGNRTIYTRDSGLSWLFLYSNLVVDSFVGLDASDAHGRVVVVNGEATATEKLKYDLMERINREHQAQLDELNSKKAEAEKAVLKIMSRKK